MGGGAEGFPEVSLSFARALIDHAADMFCVVDLDATIRFVNASVTKAFGWKASDVVGRSLLDFVHPDDLADVLLAFEQAKSRGPFEGATRARIRDVTGGWRWTETLGSNLLDDADVKGLVLHARDISDQVLAEARLSESEASFRTLFFRSPEPMWIIAADTGDFLEVNDAAIGAYGYSGPEFRTMSAGSLEQGVGGLAYSPGRHRRHHRRRDGTEIVVEMSVDELEWRGQQCLLAVARDVSDQVRLEEQLAHRALHDTLTGLANRALLYDRAAHVLSLAQRQGKPVTLLVLDVDRFKAINDAHGHLGGDAVLRELAWRFVGCVRSPDTVARLGGDEFAILLADAVDTGAGPDVARRVLREVRRPVDVRGTPVAVSVSIGVVTATETVGLSLETLLERADTAMYRAKGMGGGRVVIAESNGSEVAP